MNTNQAMHTRVPLLLLAFAGSIGVRFAVGRPQVNASATAGLLFAGLLGWMTVLCWQARRPAIRTVVLGVLSGTLGAAVLVVPAVNGRLAGGTPHRPDGSFLTWSLVVTIVALAEEFFLRGVLFEAVLHAAQGRRVSHPAVAAIAVSAVAFGILHLPLYGWTSFPLDLCVGAWLGILRYVCRTVVAPATTHVLADLAGWWLR